MSSTLPAPVVGVDVGGTFTDLYLVDDAGVRVHKTPSTPHDPSEGVLRGLREIGGMDAALVVHGSTVATNALIEGKGAKTALVTTAGFEDVLEIGRQDRPSLYDVWAGRPPPLVPTERRFGAPERVASDGSIIEALTPEAAREVAARVRASGAEAVAVCCLFSFLRPEHERMLRGALTEGGGPLVYVSHEVLPEYREYERTATTVINAFVAPVVERYLARLAGSLSSGLRVVQSSGGSVTAAAAMRRPIETISGGPAGGVAGAYRLAKDAGYEQTICFDMGGTSTDVCLCDGGVPRTNAWSLAGLPIGTPSIDIYSVGAGGGSIARVDHGGALVVGPESAGADPGPAAYGRGEAPTVTDANLVLGRLGAGDFTVAGRSLELERSRAALAHLGAAMGATPEAAAEGVVRVANANMARAIRVISVERGYDPRRFILTAFGGAGPLHACEVADLLGIPQVLVPARPGVLSAMGMTVAEVSRDYSRTVMLSGTPLPLAEARRAADGLIEQGRADMESMGIAGDVEAATSLDLRYHGQSFELTIPYDRDGHGRETPSGLAAAFHQAHRTRFGHAHDDRAIEIVTARVRLEAPGAADLGADTTSTGHASGTPRERHGVHFNGALHDTPVLDRTAMGAEAIDGPAIVAQYDSTVVIPPGWSARSGPRGNMIIERAP